ncbi:MAG: hypothetical protein C4336_09120 [Armatimonadota bacterium]
MRALGLVLASVWICGVWGQHLPVRDEPLYDLGAVLLQDIPSLMSIPRDEDEWRIALRRAPDTPLRTTALWKLGEITMLSPSQGRLFAIFTSYAFGKEDWETSAKATYRISGVWSLGEQALLEFVWSDASRRERPMGLSLPEPAPERFGTLLLADLGAEVIKVENIHVWQPLTRGLLAHPPKAMMGAGPSWTTGYPDDEPGERPWNRCPTFVSLYRNKRSVTMDIRVPEGRKPFEDLIRTADIVYENNVSETMEKLGITYDYLRSLRPDIIYIRVPAFGNTGAYRNYRALGVHLEGVSGHSLLRKYPDLDASANTQIYAGDYFAGTHGAFAAIAALHNVTIALNRIHGVPDLATTEVMGW